jgi:hypothetical protein
VRIMNKGILTQCAMCTWDLYEIAVYIQNRYINYAVHSASSVAVCVNIPGNCYANNVRDNRTGGEKLSQSFCFFLLFLGGDQFIDWISFD